MVITRRVEYLIKKYGVRPEQILVITFTKAAAKEMRERFARITKDDRFPVTFGTFHGIYYGILKWAYRMNASNIFSEEEKMMLLREVKNYKRRSFSSYVWDFPWYLLWDFEMGIPDECIKYFFGGRKDDAFKGIYCRDGI